jgi:hypothetical protein
MKKLITIALMITSMAATADSSWAQQIDIQNRLNELRDRNYQPQMTGDRSIDTHSQMMWQMRQDGERARQINEQQIQFKLNLEDTE